MNILLDNQADCIQPCKNRDDYLALLPYFQELA
jgi:hypothetical protein